MIKVSFDFDNTLSRKSIQKFAKEMKKEGHDVHIVTSRFEDITRYIDPKILESGHKDLYRACYYLNIPRENIHFTNMKYKSEYFIEHSDFVWHLDDDGYELFLINRDTTVPGVPISSINYKEICREFIEKELKRVNQQFNRN
jgi:hypothetical protein